MLLTINKNRSKTVKNGVVDCKLKTVSSGFDPHMSLVMRKPDFLHMRKQRRRSASR